jgi:hypothetical protein
VSLITFLSNILFLVDLSSHQLYREPIGRDLFCEFCASDCFADCKLSRLDSFLQAIVSNFRLECISTVDSYIYLYKLYIYAIHMCCVNRYASYQCVFGIYSTSVKFFHQDHVLSYFIYQIEYETAAESQRRELASKLTEKFLNQENGVSKGC